MTFNQLLRAEPPEWLLHSSDADDIAVVTVGRLVRNLEGFAFPGWSTTEQRRRIGEQVLPLLRSLHGCRNAFSSELSELSYEQRRVLLVRKQITPCMSARQEGCYLMIPPRQHAVYMVNEEEHLVVHSCLRGCKIREMLDELGKISTRLDEKFRFARSPETGYLTSMPSEAGDGIQLYTMLHLPAMTMSNMMSQITKALEKLHISISPCYSDGEDDTGSLYLFYTLPGPTDSTPEIAAHYRQILRRIITRERQVRLRLMDDPDLHLVDNVARAYGALRHARRISLREARNAISVLRLGTVMQILLWDGMTESEATDKLRQLDLEIAMTSAVCYEDEEPELPLCRARLARQFLKDHPMHVAPEYS